MHHEEVCLHGDANPVKTKAITHASTTELAFISEVLLLFQSSSYFKWQKIPSCLMLIQHKPQQEVRCV